MHRRACRCLTPWTRSPEAVNGTLSPLIDLFTQIKGPHLRRQGVCFRDLVVLVNVDGKLNAVDEAVQRYNIDRNQRRALKS